VRLGTCIALELVCAVGAAAGVWVVAGRGVDLAGEYLQPEASAATTTPASAAVTRLPSARLEVARPIGDTTVFEQPDELLLAPLAATPLTGIKLNHGGTSLSLRVDFASGARAAFKPQQIHPQSDPRREIAAYRIDRMLGIGHVAPAKSATFALADLIAAAPADSRDYTTQRLVDEAIVHDGKVSGEVSWWIPEIRDATIGTHRVDEPEGMAEWVPYLQAGEPMPPELAGTMAQMSTMIVFDVLIDNADRWTGNNTKCSVDHETMYFMDNTLSFTQFTFGHESNLTPLHRISKFSRKLVTRLRTLTYASVARALQTSDDPLAPLLEPGEIRALLARRDHLLRYIDGLSAELGESAVLALP
jgi:Golgi casein kinase, C-terminal, Fam20